MRPPFRSRIDLWQLLWPTLRRGRKRQRRRCQSRTAAAQQLEPREMLAASMQVFDGGTQMFNFASDNFGTANVGASDVHTFTIQNTGDQTLDVSSGSAPYGFNVQGTFPMFIGANESATFTIGLNTSSPNNYMGQFSLTTNDPNNANFSLSLSAMVSGGMGGGGILQLSDGATQLASGSSDGFGSVAVGAFDSKSFTINDESSSGLTVNSLTLPSGFYTSAAFPMTIMPYGSANFQVSLYTSAAGNYAGSMSLSSDAQNQNPFTVNLSGTVTSPAAPAFALRDGSTTLANNADDGFNSVAQGSSAVKTFAVSNSGNAPLTVSAISLPTGFSLGTTLPLTINPGNSATFTVSMDTSAVTSYAGPMSIVNSDSANSPFNVHLSGIITAPPEPIMALADGSTAIADGGDWSFGTRTTGETASEAFSLSNLGTASLTVSAVSLPSGFSLGTTLPLTVAAGGSSTLVVNMDTTAPAALSGLMAVTNNCPESSPYDVTLSGIVTAPPAPAIQVADGSTTLANGDPCALETVAVGAVESKSFTLTNTGGATLHVSAIALPEGFSTGAALPLSIAPGASSSVVIDVDTSKAAVYSGAMAITSDDAQNSPFDVDLSATIVPPPSLVAVFDGATQLVSGQSAVSFGTAAAGVAVSHSFTIEDTGSTAVSLDAQSLLLPAGFSVATPFDATVPAGGSTTLVLQMQSASAADLNGLVSFDTSDPLYPRFTFDVSGHVAAPAPAIEAIDGITVLASGDAEDFGTTPIGVPLTRSITLDNVGAAALNFAANSVLLPAGYTLVTAPAASVAAGAGTTVVVRFDASAAGESAGQMAILSNDPDHAEFDLELSGHALSPSMTVLDGGDTLANQTSTLDFAATPLGAPVTRTLTIENLGNYDLLLDPRSLSLPEGYSVVAGFATDVAPGDSTTLTLQFDAVAAGTAGGRLSFAGNDLANSPFVLTVTGMVTVPGIEMLDGTTVLASGGGAETFSPTPVGTPVDKSLTIQNVGQAPLSIDLGSFVLPAGYSLAAPPAASVAPGGSTSMVVRLDASAACPAAARRR